MGKRESYVTAKSDIYIFLFYFFLVNDKHLTAEIIDYFLVTGLICDIFRS